MAVPPRRGWSDKHERRARDAGYDSYEAWIAEIEDDVGGNVCAAWSTSYLRPCRQRIDPKPGNPRGRCHSHGANAPRGVAHYAFGSGDRIYSESLEGVLLAAYEGSHERAERQIELAEQIALHDAMEARQVERLRDAVRDGDLREAAEAEDRIRAIADDRRKLSEAERRRISAAHDAVSRDRLEALAAYLVRELRRSIVRNVSDEDARRAVLGDVSDALAQLAGARRAIGPGGGADPSGNGAGPP